MDLLEYQAKELFRQMRIPVLPSQRIDHPSDLKGLTIPYPVVLKSQVYAGNRAKAGGIRFVENTIDAVAAAQTIFSLPILGQMPDVILAEARFQPEREFYLAVVLDRSSRRPLLLGSPEGGVEVETGLAKMKRVVIDQAFSPFYARRLAIQMGLKGALIETVSDILQKMYWLFIHKDLDLLEINPLAVNSNGEVMALDGKVIVNDSALGRHDDLFSLRPKIPNPLNGVTPPVQLELVQLDGAIGVLCNGAGLTMTTLDLIASAGGQTASFINLGSECFHLAPPTELRHRLMQAMDRILQNRDIKVLLINIVGTVISSHDIAEAIATFLQNRKASSLKLPPIVVRLLGAKSDEIQSTLKPLGLIITENLDDAIAQTVKQSKPKRSKKS